nr:glycosyltransferase [Celeribacter sp. HF31]
MEQVADISVIIPVYRQWDGLSRLLQNLAAQTLSPRRYTIVVVANEPPPAGLNVAEIAQNARMIVCLTPGSYAARNVGIEATMTPFVAFTDADCLPDPDWLKGLLLRLTTDPKTLWAGRIDMDTPARETLWAAYDIIRGIPQKHYVSRGYGACANLGVARSVLEAVGGFDERRFSGGDAAFCRKAGQAGFGIAYADEVRVVHPARTTASEVITKARRVRGGQIRAGTMGRRMLWVLASCVPPFRQTWRFLRKKAPFRRKAKALLVLYVLWGVTFWETVRLVGGSNAERQ